MQTDIKRITRNFIKEVWNEQKFQKIEKYLHPQFADKSLPPGLPENKVGLRIWIGRTGQSFKHKTIIEEIVHEGDKVILKVNLHLKHIGNWRGIEPSGKEIVTSGFRYFQFRENKIIKHWALIDGEGIEKQLLVEKMGCAI